LERSALVRQLQADQRAAGGQQTRYEEAVARLYTSMPYRPDAWEVVAADGPTFAPSPLGEIIDRMVVGHVWPAAVAAEAMDVLMTDRTTTVAFACGNPACGSPLPGRADGSAVFGACPACGSAAVRLPGRGRVS
jgi:hypothetical protein